MATTPSYGWVTPSPTDFVTDLPADFEVFADAVDADLAGLLGGTTGQVLTKDSNTDHDFSWQAINAGGITQLASGTLSGAAVNVTSLPTTYKDLRIVIRNFKPADDGRSLDMRVNNDSNTRYRTRADNTVNNDTFNSTAFGNVANTNDNSVATGLTIIYFYDYANTTTWKLGETLTIGVNATTTTNLDWARYYLLYNQTSAITELNFFANVGNMTSGTYIIYGVN